MTRRAAIAAVALTVATVLLSLWSTYRGNYRHVLLVTIDTLRRDQVTTDSDDRPARANLDRLVRRGVVFDQALAANAETAPNHASIFTGLHPTAHGVLHNRDRLHGAVPTVAGLLGAAGYRTGAFISGSGLTRAQTNLDRGFGHWDEKLGGKNQRPDQRTERAATAWLWGEAHQRPPNFVFVQFFADAQLGGLLDTLETHGYWDETLVIVLAGHGETRADRAAHLNDDARIDEEQIHIPMVMRFPGDAFAGQRIAGPVHQIDLLPTILDYLDIDPPAGLQGRSLLPVIRGDVIAAFDFHDRLR